MIVSTTEPRLSRSASLTGLNLPLSASRPIFRVAMANPPIVSRVVPKQPPKQDDEKWRKTLARREPITLARLLGCNPMNMGLRMWPAPGIPGRRPFYFCCRLLAKVQEQQKPAGGAGVAQLRNRGGNRHSWRAGLRRRNGDAGPQWGKSRFKRGRHHHFGDTSVVPKVMEIMTVADGEAPDADPSGFQIYKGRI